MWPVADELDIPLPAVRSHLQHAVGKTDTHRQGELVRLLLKRERLPHILGGPKRDSMRVAMSVGLGAPTTARAALNDSADPIGHVHSK